LVVALFRLVEVGVASSGKGFCDGELLIGLENHSSR